MLTLRVVWVVGLGLGALIVFGLVYWLRHWRARDESRPLADLYLEDLVAPSAVPKPRSFAYAEDTTPAVLSVPPEWAHPEWEAPQKPSSQRWLH